MRENAILKVNLKELGEGRHKLLDYDEELEYDTMAKNKKENMVDFHKISANGAITYLRSKERVTGVDSFKDSFVVKVNWGWWAALFNKDFEIQEVFNLKVEQYSNGYLYRRDSDAKPKTVSVALGSKFYQLNINYMKDIETFLFDKVVCTVDGKKQLLSVEGNSFKPVYTFKGDK